MPSPRTPREQIEQAVNAGHPDDALVGVPVSLLREILSALPIDALMSVASKVMPA